jgi:hypothetical protein
MPLSAWRPGREMRLSRKNGGQIGLQKAGHAGITGAVFRQWKAVMSVFQEMYHDY